jgi:hypothetical protein
MPRSSARKRGSEHKGSRPDTRQYRPLVTIFVSPLQPRERLALFAEAIVCLRQEKARDIAPPGSFL